MAGAGKRRAAVYFAAGPPAGERTRSRAHASPILHPLSQPVRLATERKQWGAEEERARACAGRGRPASGGRSHEASGGGVPLFRARAAQRTRAQLPPSQRGPLQLSSPWVRTADGWAWTEKAKERVRHKRECFLRSSRSSLPNFLVEHVRPAAAPRPLPPTRPAPPCSTGIHGQLP